MTSTPQKIIETFLSFSMVYSYCEWNWPRLLSPEIECTSCLTKFQKDFRIRTLGMRNTIYENKIEIREIEIDFYILSDSAVTRPWPLSHWLIGKSLSKIV